MTPDSPDRLRPEEYRERWVEGIKRQKALLDSTDSSGVIFRLGNELLALPALAIQEVMDIPPIHSIPHRQNGILLGLANWRGELLTCVSLSALLGIPTESKPERQTLKPAPSTMEKGLPSADATAAKSSGRARMIVLNWHDRRVGFPADDVHGTVRFRMATLQSPSPALEASPGCALGLFDWGDRVVTFLDTERLMALLNENLA